MLTESPSCMVVIATLSAIAGASHSPIHAEFTRSPAIPSLMKKLPDSEVI